MSERPHATGSMPRDVVDGSCGWRRSPRPRGPSAGCSGSAAGTIIVPLLVLWLGYEQKEATGTSLAAIILIGALQPRRPRRLRQRRLLEGRPHRRSRPWRASWRAPRCSSAYPERAVPRCLRGPAGGLRRGAGVLRWTRSTGRGCSRSASPPAWPAGCVGVGGGVLFVPGAGAVRRPVAAERRGHVAGGDRAGVGWWAPGASAATATCGCATASSSGLLSPLGVLAGWSWPTPCRSARSSCPSPRCS